MNGILLPGSQTYSLLIAGSLDALTFAGIAFMIAAGLTIVFGMLNFLNAAHTSFYMLASYLAYTLSTQLGNFWLTLLVAPILVAIFGGVLERLLFQKLYSIGHTPQLLLTIGLAYVIGEATKMIWGGSALNAAPPTSLSGQVVLFGATLPLYHLFVVTVALVVIGVLATFLAFTRLGMIVRATATYPEMVGALGFKVRNIYTGVFVAGVYLAALAGVAMTPMVGAYPSMADDAQVQAFIVVVAGGLGSLSGALIVSVLLGLVQGFGSVFFSDYAIFFPFIVLGGVLLLFPLGIRNIAGR
jgi:branched-chain amino acid transport system permease protein